MRQYECVHSCETACMSVYVHSCEKSCLSMRVGGYVGEYISVLPPGHTSVTKRHTSVTFSCQYLGPELLWAGSDVWSACCMALFCRCVLVPMLGPGTRASSRLKRKDLESLMLQRRTKKLTVRELLPKRKSEPFVVVSQPYTHATQACWALWSAVRPNVRFLRYECLHPSVDLHRTCAWRVGTWKSCFGEVYACFKYAKPVTTQRHSWT